MYLMMVHQLFLSFFLSSTNDDVAVQVCHNVKSQRDQILQIHTVSQLFVGKLIEAINGLLCALWCECSKNFMRRALPSLPIRPFSELASCFYKLISSSHNKQRNNQQLSTLRTDNGKEFWRESLIRGRKLTRRLPHQTKNNRNDYVGRVILKLVLLLSRS